MTTPRDSMTEASPTPPLRFSGPVTLVGGGPLSRATLAGALARAPVLVAADQAADRVAAWGMRPDLVIGDMDSISDLEEWRGRPVRLLHLTEQETTDFEKCLYATEAPFYLACGFAGGRIDHTLAVLHGLLRRPEKRVVLIGEAEAMALVPPGRALRLKVGTGARVSIFPLVETRGTHSAGLLWDIAGLEMAPGRQIGTSNIATADEIEIGFDRPGALVMLPPDALDALVAALAG